MLLKRTSAIGLSLLLFSSIAYSNPIAKTKKADSTRMAMVEPINSAETTKASLPQLTADEKRLASKPIHDLLETQHSPFRQLLEANHNSYVSSYINKYASRNYTSHLAEMKGLASYYFPIFEKIFREVGIPSDIKYLSVIESSLNPHAVSRVGATGPWQFMYATAKGYGLQINSYVDQRKDPIEATYAAANYLKEAYDVYDDWLLAIASYNCGMGNVNRAIRRSGKSNPSFWDIRPYLPNETKNYIPSFIAISHVLGNPTEYPVEVSYADLPEAVDIIMVSRNISLASVAETLGISQDYLYTLNPSYKKKIINGTKINPGRLIVPKVAKRDYAKLYNFLEGKLNGQKVMLANNNERKGDHSASPQYHRVRKGEKLAEIALHYNVETRELLAWNNLKEGTKIEGRNLIVATANPDVKQRIAEEPSKSKENSYYIAYKVRNGDTLDGIAKRFKGSTVSSLKAMNGLTNNTIKPGMTLKIMQD
ncbi:lytic transglycosylase domain-containing protein [Albibacterium profundi]|uniref:Transglycosylase SLT domain-containing protein n=1 Tax=Albibacterium profundi TaxID=3134906 RepID=A0ABV5CCX9_9SPHI